MVPRGSPVDVGQISNPASGASGGTFTVTWDGFTVPQAHIWQYSKSGNAVTLAPLSAILGTSNSANTTAAAGTIPAAIRPVSTQLIGTRQIPGYDGATFVADIMIQFAPDGSMQVYRYNSNFGPGTWVSAAGQRGFFVTLGLPAFWQMPFTYLTA